MNHAPPAAAPAPQVPHTGHAVRWLLAAVALCAAAALMVLIAGLAAGRPTLPATVDRDASLPRVVLGGYPFHAERFGAPGRPVLIVLHGGPGADYRYLLGLKALADTHQVVFYDQRGTGLSPRVPPAQITVQGFVDDLDAVVDHFGQGRPVHLLGHSWGAMLASAYTGAHPGKVASLVLAEPGFLDQQAAEVYRQMRPSLRMIVGMAAAWLGQWRVPADGDPYARDDWLLQQVMPLTQGPEQMCPGGQPPAEAWRFGSPSFQATVARMQRDPAFMQQLDFRRGVDAYTGPTLFLAGACNRVIGPAHQQAQLRHFRHVRLEVIEGAGHYLFNDQPERSLTAVRAFLAAR